VAKGEYLCFIDADGELTKNWLEEANKVLERNNTDAIVGLVVFEHKNITKRILYNIYIFFAYLGIYLSKIFFGKSILPGNNFVIKKDIFLKTGGFDPVVGEDIWLSKKFCALGGKSVVNLKMIIYYSSRGFEATGFIRTIIFWITATITRKACGDYSYKNKNWEK
jgi:cellulose synthase/poly-beta-1,6-N-acetylglucosamine synthase-like glycosyltransferase